MKGIVLRIATGGAVAAVLMTMIALPASAAVTVPAMPVVSIANPNSGDYWRRGANWVIGVACDPNAPATEPQAGISRIQIFLGDRDAATNTPFWRPGGYITQATAGLPNVASNGAVNGVLGLPNPDVSSGCKQSNAGFRLLPNLRKGIWTMNIYVLTKAGQESKTTISNLRVDHP
jgi:hypothetical protein